MIDSPVEGMRARVRVQLSVCVSTEMQLTDDHMEFIMYCLHPKTVSL